MTFISGDLSSLRIIMVIACLILLVVSVMAYVARVGGEELRPDADLRREKRRTKRIKSNAVFDLEDGRGGFKPGNAQLIDISAWGVCIRSAVSLDEGQQVRGRVRSYAESPLQISGRVVWVTRKRGESFYGIAFDQLKRLPL